VARAGVGRGEEEIGGRVARVGVVEVGGKGDVRGEGERLGDQAGERDPVEVIWEREKERFVSS
jgi:hypothetical protein